MKIDWSGSFGNGFKTGMDIMHTRDRYKYEQAERERQYQYHEAEQAAGKDVSVVEGFEQDVNGEKRHIPLDKFRDDPNFNPQTAGRSRFQVGDKMFDDRAQAEAYAKKWNDPLAKSKRLYDVALKYGNPEQADKYQKAYEGMRKTTQNDVERGVNNMLMSGDFQGLSSLVSEVTGQPLRFQETKSGIALLDAQGKPVGIYGSTKDLGSHLMHNLNLSTDEQLSVGQRWHANRLTEAQTKATETNTAWTPFGMQTSRMNANAALANASAAVRNSLVNQEKQEYYEGITNRELADRDTYNLGMFAGAGVTNPENKLQYVPKVDQYGNVVGAVGGPNNNAPFRQPSLFEQEMANQLKNGGGGGKPSFSLNGFSKDEFEKNLPVGMRVK